MVGIPSGLKALANASLDPGVLSLPLYGDDRQRLHQRGSRKPILRKMIRKTARLPRPLATEHGRDLGRGAAGEPVPAALRTPLARYFKKVPLF